MQMLRRILEVIEIPQLNNQSKHILFFNSPNYDVCYVIKKIDKIFENCI